MVKKNKNPCLSLSKRKLHENRLKGLKNLKDKREVNKVDCAGDTASTSNDGWSTDEQPWMEGRRIIELAVVLSSLRACSNCGEKISLLNIEDETRMGLGSIFYVRCELCLEFNAVASGKRHVNPCMDMTGDAGKGRKSIFDVNTKLAAGMYNTHFVFSK